MKEEAVEPVTRVFELLLNRIKNMRSYKILFYPHLTTRLHRGSACAKRTNTRDSETCAQDTKDAAPASTSGSSVPISYAFELQQ